MKISATGNLGNGGITDSSCRIVDDALEGLLIIGVNNQTEVGNDILDLLTLIEAETAINPIRNALLEHLFLESAALSIGAIENGKIVILAVFPAHQPSDFVADDGSFFLIAVGLLQDNTFALVITTIDIFGNLPLVLLDKTVGGLYDALRAAVILFQLE